MQMYGKLTHYDNPSQLKIQFSTNKKIINTLFLLINN